MRQTLRPVAGSTRASVPSAAADVDRVARDRRRETRRAPCRSAPARPICAVTRRLELGQRPGLLAAAESQPNDGGAGIVGIHDGSDEQPARSSERRGALQRRVRRSQRARPASERRRRAAVIASAPPGPPLPAGGGVPAACGRHRCAPAAAPRRRRPARRARRASPARSCGTAILRVELRERGLVGGARLVACGPPRRGCRRAGRRRCRRRRSSCFASSVRSASSYCFSSNSTSASRKRAICFRSSSLARSIDPLQLRLRAGLVAGFEQHAARRAARRAARSRCRRTVGELRHRVLRLGQVVARAAAALPRRRAPTPARPGCAATSASPARATTRDADGDDDAADERCPSASTTP